MVEELEKLEAKLEVKTIVVEEIGKVVSWNTRGFGFLENANGVNFFCHVSQWVDPYDPPIVGKAVRFEVGPAVHPRKRDQANNVRVIKAGA